ncbi:IclR family transcriptional regulator domain-containing protein, partial [Glutamicibacter sp. BSL13]
KVREARRLGYSVTRGLIVKGSWGMGAAVFDASGPPAWALSVTGIESRFTPGRRPELGALLLHHAHELSQQLRRG